MENASLAEYLRNEESNPVFFQGKVTRFVWFHRLLGDDTRLNHVLVAGGGGKVTVHWYLFWEMRWCFIQGQFLATVLLGLAFIERILAARYYEIGRDDLVRAKFSCLLKQALADSLISDNQSEGLNKARQYRNAYAHFRKPGSETDVVYRTQTGEHTLPYDVIEEDAVAVITTALGLSARLSSTYSDEIDQSPHYRVPGRCDGAGAGDSDEALE